MSETKLGSLVDDDLVSLDGYRLFRQTAIRGVVLR